MYIIESLLFFFQLKTATINVVLTFHLTTVAELEVAKEAKHRADALEASNHAIAIFEKVCHKSSVLARPDATFGKEYYDCYLFVLQYKAYQQNLVNTLLFLKDSFTF